MSFPEGPSGHEPREHEPLPYSQAARFAGEKQAGEAYRVAQDAIYTAPHADVSVFRFQLNRLWHVAALGEEPPADLAAVLNTVFATGEPVSLPPELLQMLAQRRAHATRQAPWVERHVRQLPPDESGQA